MQTRFSLEGYKRKDLAKSTGGDTRNGSELPWHAVHELPHWKLFFRKRRHDDLGR